jgi:hypothetical protein
MALILLNPGTQPLGQFDGYTGTNGAGTGVTAFKGGEICSWQSMNYPALGAQDVNDGYAYNATATPHIKVVPSISLNWGTQTTPALTPSHGPYFLSDDGTQGYGTLFGSIVGGSVGSQSYAPYPNNTGQTVIGPHTALGSGKITCWDKPGMYAVTLDAVSTTTSVGLLPTNTALFPGMALYFTTNGLLCAPGETTTLATGANVVGRFADFSTNGSYVTTPQSLVAALNSPSGDVSSVSALSFYQMNFWFYGAGASNPTN